MPLEILSADSLIDEGEYKAKFLVMGEPGGGKTTALTTFPSSLKVLVLDIYGNKESLEGASNVDIVSYSHLDPRDPSSYITIDQDRRELVKRLDSGSFEWDVLCLDTITGIIRLAEFYILATNPDGRGIGGAPAQHHYRGLSHVVGEFIMSFVGYPIHTVMNAHVEYEKDDFTGLMRYVALMSGKKWRHSIYAYVGEVYRAFGIPSDEMGTDGEPTTEYFWQTQPDRQWPMLKSVLNKKQAYWGKYVEPSYEQLLKRRGVVK